MLELIMDDNLVDVVGEFLPTASIVIYISYPANKQQEHHYGKEHVDEYLRDFIY